MLLTDSCLCHKNTKTCAQALRAILRATATSGWEGERVEGGSAGAFTTLWMFYFFKLRSENKDKNSDLKEVL